MSLSKPLDELVLPGRESIWKAQKPNWFVTDPDCPDQKREPGMYFKFNAQVNDFIQVFLKKNFLFKAGPRCF